MEFDVHLSKDHVPVVYHDLTCCMAMKKVIYECAGHISVSVTVTGTQILTEIPGCLVKIIR